MGRCIFKNIACSEQRFIRAPNILHSCNEPFVIILVFSHPSLFEGVILFVLANKQDLKDAKSVDEIIEKLNLKQFDGKRPWFIKGISALDGSGIQEAMDTLAKKIKEHYKEKAAKEKQQAKEKEQNTSN
jgi:signal recognition particle receptor subunit beta